MKPTFNKRHYEVVAGALKEARSKLDADGYAPDHGIAAYAVLTVATTLADKFRQDNPKFDTYTFMKRIRL